MEGKHPDESIRAAEVVRTVGRMEFDAAVAAFAVQLDATLTGSAGDGYCVGFDTTARSALFAKYRMQGDPCSVRFDLGPDGALEAWVESLTAKDQLVVLRWACQTWMVIGKGVSTSVYDVPAKPDATADGSRDSGSS